MRYRIFAVALAAMLMLTGCSNSSGASGTTTESVAQPSEAWDYEMYVEDLDYYMEQYIQLYDSARDAFRIQDTEATKNYLDSLIDALNGLDGIVYPPELEEAHSVLLYAAGLEKELAEVNLELNAYVNTTEELTDKDQDSLEKINAKADEILTKMEDGGSIRKAWMNAKNAAFSYLPNGEYKSYTFNLETLWDKYITEYNTLYDIFFEGVEGDAVLICENCLEILSEIENIEAPEQVKPYHDDVIAALSQEREYCQAVKTIRELNIEYQGVAFEDLPDDIREQVNECSEIIDNYFNEENPDYDAAYNAVAAAFEFAEALAGQ